MVNPLGDSSVWYDDTLLVLFMHAASTRLVLPRLSCVPLAFGLCGQGIWIRQVFFFYRMIKMDVDIP